MCDTLLAVGPAALPAGSALPPWTRRNGAGAGQSYDLNNRRCILEEWPCENGSMGQDKETSSFSFELNIQADSGFPTLVPSLALERQLDFRLLIADGDNVLSSIGNRRDVAMPESMRIAIHIHCYYVEELTLILEALERCFAAFPPESTGLFLTTDTEDKHHQIISLITDRELANKVSLRRVQLVENRGRNLRPLFHDIYPLIAQYDVALHLHAKRSVGNNFGRQWLLEILHSLLPSRSEVASILDAFKANPELGLIMPQPGASIRPLANWGSNFVLARMLCSTIFPDRVLEPQAPLLFPAGMMFWFRPAALQKMAATSSQLVGLVSEPVAQDGTLLHALERLSAHFCEAAGYQWALAVSKPEQLPESSASKTFAEVSVWQKNEEAYLHATRQLAEDLKYARFNLESLRQVCAGQAARIQDFQDEASQLLLQLNSGFPASQQQGSEAESIPPDTTDPNGNVASQGEGISRLGTRLKEILAFQTELSLHGDALDRQVREERQLFEQERQQWIQERESLLSSLRNREKLWNQERQDLSVQLDSQQQELSEWRNRHEEAERELVQLREVKTHYQQANHQISELNVLLGRRDEQIASLRHQYSESLKRYRHLNRELAECKAEMSRLGDQILAERDERTALQTQLQKSFRHRLRSLTRAWTHRLQPLLPESRGEYKSLGGNS